MDSSEAQSPAYRFGPFVIDTGRGMLLRDGREIPLRAQSFEVLLLLVVRQGQLVTRDELMSTVWAGKKVTDASVTQCLVEIRAALGDADRSMVRTLPRRGYLFEAPVETTQSTRSAPTAALLPRRFRSLAMLTAVLLAALLGIAHWMQPADEPVLAVLSFESRGELTVDRHFAEGFHDQVLSALGTIEGLNVISRLSIAELERQSFTLEDVRTELGATHAMTGSIDRQDDVVRLSVQIVDTRNGRQLLAQSYERPIIVQDLSGLQRDVAYRVADAIGLSRRTSSGGTPGEAESSRSLIAGSTTNDLVAYEKFLDGLYYLRRIQIGERTEEDFVSAAERFQSAIDADPGWAAPRAALGMVYHFQAGLYDDESYEELLHESLRHVTAALELDPDYAPAYISLGFLRTRLGPDFAGAEQAYDRAYELGERTMWPWASGLLAVDQGNFEEAVPLLRQARVRDPLNWIIREQLAAALMCARRYDESTALYREMADVFPEYRPAWMMMIAYNLVQSGNLDEGEALFEEYGASASNGASRAILYALLDRPVEAEKLIALAEQQEDWGEWGYAEAAVVLGQTDRALTLLEKGAETAPMSLRKIECSAHIAALDGNARYDRVLRQIGLK